MLLYLSGHEKPESFRSFFSGLSKYVLGVVDDNNPDVQWKYDHTLRVLDFCKGILVAHGSCFEGTEIEEVLDVAALLHDTGRFIQFSRKTDPERKEDIQTKRNHGQVGSEFIRDVLVPEFGFTGKNAQWKTRLVLDLVGTHDLPDPVEEISFRYCSPGDVLCARLLSSILRDADIADNILNLFSERWFERIDGGGYATFDVSDRRLSDEAASSVIEVSSGQDVDFDRNFNPYCAKTLGDAVLFKVLLVRKLRFRFTAEHLLENYDLSRDLDLIDTPLKDRIASLVNQKLRRC